MVSVPYLDKADLGPLANAAASWKALPAKYESLQREFEQRVINHLKGHWEGDAAEAAFATMGKARTEYENAATEAERIAKLLLDAHSEFAASQKQLHTLLDEARTDNYKVYDDGRVEDIDPRQDSPTASGTPGLAEERKQKLDSLVSRLTHILEVATAADEATHAALQRDANGDSQSFNTSVYTSLDAVEADQASALMNKKGRLTDAEITKLNLLLSAN
ncbi:PPE family protein [Streptomyces sp. cf386]|uniref:PPE domain-containing protein n=1 Tax=Streptomyces sp. cf386 TaxID=1761904 RepID=UPI0008828667|nr:PPE domain-containing protein [Streptomyces sp. cf386]SDP65470.1 PPE family protein [Streptomyces sp. cf386]